METNASKSGQTSQFSSRDPLWMMAIGMGVFFIVMALLFIAG